MTDLDIDQQQQDGAQEPHLRRFTPGPEYKRFVVTALRNIYDEDQGRVIAYVHAIGPQSAKTLGHAKLAEKYPDAFVLRAVPECPECHDDGHANNCIVAGCGCRRVAEEVVGAI